VVERPFFGTGATLVGGLLGVNPVILGKIGKFAPFFARKKKM
jgi:hypothetical protein